MIRRSRELHERRVLKILGYLERHFYEQVMPLSAEVCNFGDGIVAFDDRLNGEYKAVVAGDAWGENFGKSWDHAWFKLQAVVPAEWQGKRVVALMHINAEGTIFDTEGMPLTCITAYSEWDQAIKRERIEVFERASGGERVELWIEASVSLMYGINVDPYVTGDVPTKYGHHKAVVDRLDLAIWRKDIWELYLDMETLYALCKALPEKSVRRDRILHCLNKAIDILEFDEETIRACRDILKNAPMPARSRLMPWVTRILTPPGCGHTKRAFASARALFRRKSCSMTNTPTTSLAHRKPSIML